MSDIVTASLIGIIPGILTIILVVRQRKKLEDIHTLTNSNMGIALSLNAANSRWRADMSKKPEDIQAADQAAELLKIHEKNQSQVDSRK